MNGNVVAESQITPFKTLYKPGENLVYSPVSLLYAIGMLMALSTEECSMRISNEIFGSNILNEVMIAHKRTTTGLADKTGARICIANSVWVNEQIEGADNEAIKSIMEYYSAAVEKVDFADAGAVGAINNWVRENTNNLIDSLIERTSPDDMMYILNAIYMKANWAHQFKPEKTTQGTFIKSDGGNTSVQFMRLGIKAWYSQNGDVQALSLPYALGGLTCLFVMPKRQDISEFIGEITAKKLDTIQKDMEFNNVKIVMPKVKIRSTLDLKQALVKMGAGHLFSAAEAGLNKVGKLYGESPYVSKVIQKTYLNLDENGTEAAAVTAACLMRGMSMQVEEVAELLVFDKPFTIFIKDGEGNILFAGAINDPNTNN